MEIMFHESVSLLYHVENKNVDIKIFLKDLLIDIHL